MRTPCGPASREAIDATTFVRPAPTDTFKPVRPSTSACIRLSVPSKSAQSRPLSAKSR